MKVYTYSEARRCLAEVLDTARKEEVVIKRRGGDQFSVIRKSLASSPFDIPGIKTAATTADIVAAIRTSRARGTE